MGRHTPPGKEPPSERPRRPARLRCGDDGDTGCSRDRGVTPVVATVTMVLIAVLLAATLGAAMLGFASGLRAGPPQLSVEFSYIQEGNEYEVVASIHGGEVITKENTGNLTLVAESGETQPAPKTAYPLEGGDDVHLNDDTGGNVPAGTVVRLVWEGPDGKSSHVIARGRTPY